MNRKHLSRAAFILAFTTLVLYIIWEPRPVDEMLPEDHLIILVSKGAGSLAYERYGEWIARTDSSILCIDTYHLDADSVSKLIPMASGILFSGGPDVHPSFYGRTEDTTLCGKFDHYRDSLEFELIRHVRENRIPVFGICRGLQILNIALGGSLYADLPFQYRTQGIAHRCGDPDTCYHDVVITGNSYLAHILDSDTGSVITVNSNHHQGIRDHAPSLNVGARSTDGLTESVEWLHPELSSYLFAVQWHPEKMPEDSVSSLLAGDFISACRAYQERNH